MSGYHVMLDLETMDTVPTAAIVSIGAVVFSREYVETHNTFYTAVDAHSSIGAGLTESNSTMEWWARQSAEAMAVFTDVNRLPLQHALAQFSAWFPPGAKLWGNGASFDNAILATAYRAVGVTPPWDFWNDRCYRTATAGLPRRVQAGTHHNALDDATSQAFHLLQEAPEAIR